MQRLYVFTIALLCFSQFSIAQDTITSVLEKIGFIELEEFSLIQNNRLQLPFSEQNRDIIILDKRIIKTLPIQSINELLEYVGGVDVKQRSPWGGQADISINGGTFDQTLILLNGVKIIDPQTGHNTMNLPIPLSIIERVEVLKGAAASRYGINALNGVINIVTSQPKESGFAIDVNWGSSFEKDTSNQQLYNGIGVDLFGSFVTKKTEHLLSFSTIQTNGHRYNTGMNNNKLFYQNQIHLKNNNHLQIMAGGIFNDFGANAFYAAPGDVNSKETIQTGLAIIKGSFAANKNWKILPTVNYRLNKDDYVFIKQNPEVYRNIHITNVVNAIIDNSISTNIGTVGFGLEYRSEFINSNSLGKWNRDNYGLYGEFAFTKVNNLNLSLGAYLNYSEHLGFKALPSIDVGYKFAKYWQIYANAGTGTRVPTYTDWYYNGPSNIGNSNLLSENSFSTEGGVRFIYNQLKISGNYFYRNISDVIDWVKNDLNDPWQTQNFQEIKTHGFTVSGDYTLLDSSSEKAVSITTGVSYTWLNPIVTQDYKLYLYSNYALENLRDQLIARVNLGFLKNYNVSISGRYEKRVNYKDYFLLDAKIYGEWNGIQANISLNNITNVSYIEAGAVPMPGRWVSVGVAWSWWKKIDL